MEFRRFVNSVIVIPAMIIRRSRTITIRVIGYHAALGRSFSLGLSRISFVTHPGQHGSACLVGENRACDSTTVPEEKALRG
jgi:hypothetical protein